jgi:hypothetical protein
VHGPACVGWADLTNTFLAAQACMWNYGASENMLYEGAGNASVGHPTVLLQAGHGRACRFGRTCPQ